MTPKPAGFQPAASEPSPIIGRVHEKAELELLIDQASSGNPAALVLEGEGGIGKSRLFQHAASYAAERGWCVAVTGADWFEPGVPYASLDHAIRSIDVGRCEGAKEARARVVELLDVSDAHKVTDVRAAVLRLFGVLRECSPVLLAIDDIHLADDETVALVSVLIRAQATFPLLLLCATRKAVHRSVTALGSTLDRLDRRDSLAIVEIGRLSGEDLGALITARAGAPPSERLVRLVEERSGGNAFFAIQTLLALHESATLVVDAGLATVSEDVVTLSLGRRQTLLQRVLRVSEDAWSVGRAMALLSPVGVDRIELIAELAELPIGRADKAFDALIQQGVLVAGADATFTFAHQLLREAIAQDIGPAERRRIHQRVADWLQTRGQSAQGRDVLERARHVAEIAEPGDHGAAAALIAAAELICAAAPRAAIGWYRGAIRLLDPEGADVIHWRARLARALYLAPLPREAADEGRAVLKHLPAGAERTRTAGFVTEALMALAEVEMALDLVDDEIATVGAQVRLAGQRAHLLAAVGRPEEAFKAAREMSVNLGSANVSEQVIALIHLSHMLAATGRRGELADLWNELDDLEPCLTPEQRLGIHINRSEHYSLEGRVQAEAHELACARQLADQLGGDIFRVQLALADLMHSFNTGAWPQLLDAAATLRPELEEHENYTMLSIIDPMEIEVLANRGDFAAARRIAARGLPTHPIYRDLRTWALAGLDLLTGRHAQAIASLEHAFARRSSGCKFLPQDLLLARLVEVHLAAGHPDLARRVAEVLAASPANERTPASEIEWRLLQGVAFADIEQAREGLVLANTLGGPFPIARAELMLGELGDRPEVHLRAAHEGFHSLGATPWRRRAATALRRANLKVPRHRTAAARFSELEMQMARLVQAGSRNRDIANALNVSVSLVEMYLSRIYAKVGCKSRLELARLLDAGLLEEARGPATPST